MGVVRRAWVRLWLGVAGGQDCRFRDGKEAVATIRCGKKGIGEALVGRKPCAAFGGLLYCGDNDYRLPSLRDPLRRSR
jgi:hypothetical protein